MNCKWCGKSLENNDAAMEHAGECPVMNADNFAASKLVNTPEPAPIHTGKTPVWELVIADMKERDNFGRQKYGTPLTADNGRDPLVDAYQEALDLVVYLRQAIEERK